ncbi:MAG: hypothetical protein JRN06_02975 [Nitrososphaerota archaeon]|nr:hypothetical protein [Nitrososphaerota archaeon]MDG7023179.1 hypothetical protein [Nitrososphaerota archaeon]
MAASPLTQLNLDTLPVYNSYLPYPSPPGNYGGAITNAGNQQYVIMGGVAAKDGVVFSAPVPAGTHVQFRLQVSVVGLSTSGSGSLSVPSGGANGRGEAGVVNIQITDAVAAQTFGNSEMPLFFTGIATLGGQGPSVPVMVESAYWNPFGGPIVIASADGTSVFLVITYSVATIDWSGVEVDSVVAGTLGSTAVTGFTTNIANAHENLVTGVEQDSGQILFYGFTSVADGSPISQLAASGSYNGLTKFTSAGGIDCSGAFGVPCFLTGASSSGQFVMHSADGALINGKYATTWSVPSTFTSTTITATVTQH